MERFRTILFDFINGIRSGIPLCCVIYFCKQERKNRALDTFLKRNPNKSRYEFNSSGVNYVRCDKCYEQDIKHKIKENGTILKWLLPKR